MARTLRPPDTAGCRRWTRRPEDDLDRVTRRYEYLDELDVRRAYRLSLEQILGRPAGWADGVLYRDTPDPLQRALRETAWEIRWGTARMLEFGFLSVTSVALELLERAWGCPRANRQIAEVVAWQLGRVIHQVLQQRYRRAYPANRVSLDNRVYFGRGRRSERLSVLAQQDRRTRDYDLLNHALAGGRIDIADLDRREMWEIKPASMASLATLQLWGYLDNFEIARAFEREVRGGQTRPFVAGNPRASRIAEVVKRPIEISLMRGRIRIVAKAFVLDRLPGLIPYALSLKIRRRGRMEDVVRQGLATYREAHEAATRRDLERARADEAFWRTATHVAQEVRTASELIIQLIQAAGALGVRPGGGPPLGPGRPAVPRPRARPAVPANAGSVLLQQLATARPPPAAYAPAFDDATRQAMGSLAAFVEDLTGVLLGDISIELPPEGVGPAVQTALECGLGDEQQ